MSPVDSGKGKRALDKVALSVLIFFCGLLALIMTGTFAEHTSEKPRSGVTRIQCLCATDQDSIGPMLRAYKDDDLAAVAGLFSRGKAIQIAEGT